ncbi:MAG: hypothetical protein ACR650_06815 [Methylocystis sp.]|jgi:hypothetical protein
MALLPKDRVELVLMSDQVAPVHLWIQSTPKFVRRFEFDRDRSFRVLAGAALFFIFALYFFPAATVLLSLMGLIVLFPMGLVGLAGYFRGQG